MPPTRRQNASAGNIAGFTLLQKYQLCKLREKFPTMKLSQFALLDECFKRPDGRPLAVSSLSDHLKGWEARVKEDPPAGPGAQKKKSRAAQYPFFEHFLALWIDAAESERIAVTDDIIRSQGKVIQQELLRAGVTENYDGFEFSGGWLANFKGRYNIGRLKRHGEAGQVDECALPIHRQRLSELLEPFAPDDRYNCDESGLVYNKQPQSSNVRKDKGKSLSGSKDSKLRISTLHIVNSTGTDKRKLWVISRSKNPHAFKQNRINPANLPVNYRYNKKAWMLTGIWYDFLHTLNTQMRIEKRHIALVTDNCPTHPNPLRPPNNYSGPPPPVLTNITLIYLPPNTTSHLQPLDQGIIKAFKAAYRRHYADNMVQYFNENGVAPQHLDILQAIHLIARAWDSISIETIVNCWRKAGICGREYQNQEYQNQGRGLDNQLQHFIAQQRTYCQIAMRQMFDPQSSFQTPDPEWAPAFDKYFTFDEDTPDSEVLNEYQLTTTFPDPVEMVQAGVRSGILLRDPSQLDNDPEMDEDLVLNHSGIVGKKPLSESPIATIDEAMHYSNELSRYLQALKITELHTPSGKELPVAEIVKWTSDLRMALIRHKHTSNVFQTKINKFFGGSLQSYKNGGATAPCIAVRSESLAHTGVYDDEAPQLRYPSPLENQDADGSEIEPERIDSYQSDPLECQWSREGMDRAYQKLSESV